MLKIDLWWEDMKWDPDSIFNLFCYMLFSHGLLIIFFLSKQISIFVPHGCISEEPDIHHKFITEFLKMEIKSTIHFPVKSTFNGSLRLCPVWGKRKKKKKNQTQTPSKLRAGWDFYYFGENYLKQDQWDYNQNEKLIRHSK